MIWHLRSPNVAGSARDSSSRPHHLREGGRIIIRIVQHPRSILRLNGSLHPSPSLLFLHRRRLRAHRLGCSLTQLPIGSSCSASSQASAVSSGLWPSTVSIGPACSYSLSSLRPSVRPSWSLSASSLPRLWFQWLPIAQASQVCPIMSVCPVFSPVPSPFLPFPPIVLTPRPMPSSLIPCLT